ncbi:hypothetical protein [Rufibacter sp. XAAS-G3-1]|uniref:hypothetical protein n=1 Tax=Rufibacter sp. XAAS-G3-1 TaxID=2729134 RepID=UPI0015E7BCDA|nr:hypothetical protein [Rufibacter sp. XAAS-G3-1]
MGHASGTRYASIQIRSLVRQAEARPFKELQPLLETHLQAVRVYRVGRLCGRENPVRYVAGIKNGTDRNLG